MSIFKYLLKRDKTAATAKERLQIIISHERTQRSSPDYLPKLKEDLLNVLSKYFTVSRDCMSVNVERMGDNTILELNVTMPEKQAEAADAK